MTVDHTPEPLWINEPDWLCAVEFLNDADPESRDLAADIRKCPVDAHRASVLTKKVLDAESILIHSLNSGPALSLKFERATR